MSITIRTFIAVEIGPMDELVKYEDDITSTGAEVKLVEPENIHITLKFLGDTPEKMVNDILEIIRESCSGIKPFKLEFQDVGAFPNTNYIKILWVGMKDHEPLEGLAKDLNSKLIKLGFPAEKRGFKPHITLGRVKSRKNKQALKELVIKNKDRNFGVLNVGSVCLKKSVLSPSGPTYSTLDKIELK